MIWTNFRNISFEIEMINSLLWEQFRSQRKCVMKSMSKMKNQIQMGFAIFFCYLCESEREQSTRIIFLLLFVPSIAYPTVVYVSVSLFFSIRCWSHCFYPNHCDRQRNTMKSYYTRTRINVRDLALALRKILTIFRNNWAAQRPYIFAFQRTIIFLIFFFFIYSYFEP